MRISLIVAVAENGVIGRQGDLPWHLPADLRRFKKRTMGHHLVMGRKTYESIGRPLPGRTSIVVTRQPDYSAAGARVVHRLDDAFRLAENAGENELFVIGGAEVYAAALPRADRIYRTCILRPAAGDTYFPALDPDTWQLVEEEAGVVDERNRLPHRFRVLERAPSPATGSNRAARPG